MRVSRGYGRRGVYAKAPTYNGRNDVESELTGGVNGGREEKALLRLVLEAIQSSLASDCRGLFPNSMLGRIGGSEVKISVVKRWAELTWSGVGVFKIDFNLFLFVFPSHSLASRMIKIRFFKVFGSLMILDSLSLDSCFSKSWCEPLFQECFDDSSLELKRRSRSFHGVSGSFGKFKKKWVWRVKKSVSAESLVHSDKSQVVSSLSLEGIFIGEEDMRLSEGTTVYSSEFDFPVCSKVFSSGEKEDPVCERVCFELPTSEGGGSLGGSVLGNSEKIPATSPDLDSVGSLVEIPVTGGGFPAPMILSGGVFSLSSASQAGSNVVSTVPSPVENPTFPISKVVSGSFEFEFDLGKTRRVIDDRLVQQASASIDLGCQVSLSASAGVVVPDGVLLSSVHLTVPVTTVASNPVWIRAGERVNSAIHLKCLPFESLPSADDNSEVITLPVLDPDLDPVIFQDLTVLGRSDPKPESSDFVSMISVGSESGPCRSLLSGMVVLDGVLEGVLLAGDKFGDLGATRRVLEDIPRRGAYGISDKGGVSSVNYCSLGFNTIFAKNLVTQWVRLGDWTTLTLHEVLVRLSSVFGKDFRDRKFEVKKWMEEAMRKVLREKEKIKKRKSSLKKFSPTRKSKSEGFKEWLGGDEGKLISPLREAANSYEYIQLRACAYRKILGLFAASSKAEGKINPFCSASWISNKEIVDTVDGILDQF